MINNFESFKNFCTFNSQDEFYFVQVIKRRKENPEMKNSQKKLKDFFIHSIEDLDKLEPKIIELCLTNKARAYIKPSKLSFHNTTILAARNMLKLSLGSGVSTKSANSIFASACGDIDNYMDKKYWVIDIDTTDNEELNRVSVELIKEFPLLRIKIIDTPNGYHLITTGFNPNLVNLSRYEIKKGGLTILAAYKE